MNSAASYKISTGTTITGSIEDELEEKEIRDTADEELRSRERLLCLAML